MSDQDSRYEDLERTDVLPQLALQADQPDNIESTAQFAQTSRLAEHAARPFGTAAHTNSATGRITALPAKPSTTDLAVGGIRGKIADLENRLLETQDRHVDLTHHCEQLTQRCRANEQRATKAEANYVQQSSDLHRVTLHAGEAQQRLQEERVRFQAQIAEVERQLVDMRTRGEKRATSLEQLLNEQTERTALSERAASEARVELGTVRGELGVAQASVQSLEERLAEQTQAVTEVTRLYSQQTSQVAANAELMIDTERKLADVQAETVERDDRIADLETELRSASEAVATLQAEIAMKLRHIAASETGLENRDRSIDALKAQLAEKENSTAELMTAKATLGQRCTELEQAVADARDVVANAEQEIARLSTALRGNDVRINELAESLRAAERGLKERDTVIAEAVGRADVSRSEYAQAVEVVDELRRRLDGNEQQIDELQTQLLTRTAELNAAQESTRVSQTREAESMAEMRKLEEEFDKTRNTMERVVAERNQFEIENQSGRAELSRIQARYEEAVQTIVAARESISVREQKNASLERELRAATLCIEETNARIERAATVAEGFNAELRQRDNRIAMLEQKCEEHASALNAIGQDIERVNSANPSERLAAMGYALESIDQPGAIHRIGRMTTTVGRAATNDVAIDSTSVSRYHARIAVQPEGVWLIDLQSTNGCGVNGRRISRQILCDGDAVMIGHCKFRFSVLGASKEEQAPSEAFPLLDEPLFIPATRGTNHESPSEQRH